MLNKKIGFIGLGNMAGSILKAAIELSLVDKNNILFKVKTLKTTKAIVKKFGIQKTKNHNSFAECDIIFLGVKPDTISEVAKELKKVINKNTLIISMAAGVTIENLEKKFNSKNVIRIMPNTPISVGAGCTAICYNKDVSQNNMKLIKNFFDKLGYCFDIDEKDINTISALSGSGPAYFFFFLDAMQKAAKENCNIDEKLINKILCYTLLGIAKLALASDKPFSNLINEVTSPKGSTREAIDVFKEEKIQNIIIKAINSAMDKNNKMNF